MHQFACFYEMATFVSKTGLLWGLVQIPQKQEERVNMVNIEVKRVFDLMPTRVSWIVLLEMVLINICLSNFKHLLKSALIYWV